MARKPETHISLQEDEHRRFLSLRLCLTLTKPTPRQAQICNAINFSPSGTVSSFYGTKIELLDQLSTIKSTQTLMHKPMYFDGFFYHCTPNVVINPSIHDACWTHSNGRLCTENIVYGWWYLCVAAAHGWVPPQLYGPRPCRSHKALLHQPKLGDISSTMWTWIRLHVSVCIV